MRVEKSRAIGLGITQRLCCHTAARMKAGELIAHATRAMHVTWAKHTAEELNPAAVDLESKPCTSTRDVYADEDLTLRCFV